MCLFGMILKWLFRCAGLPGSWLQKICSVITFFVSSSFKNLVLTFSHLWIFYAFQKYTLQKESRWVGEFFFLPLRDFIKTIIRHCCTLSAHIFHKKNCTTRRPHVCFFTAVDICFWFLWVSTIVYNFINFGYFGLYALSVGFTKKKGGQRVLIWKLLLFHHAFCTITNWNTELQNGINTRSLPPLNIYKQKQIRLTAENIRKSCIRYNYKSFIIFSSVDLWNSVSKSKKKYRLNR